MRSYRLPRSIGLVATLVLACFYSAGCDDAGEKTDAGAPEPRARQIPDPPEKPPAPDSSPSDTDSGASSPASPAPTTAQTPPPQEQTPPERSTDRQASPEPSTQSTEQNDTEGFVMYRLANVIIPPDSRHRKNTALNHPPKVYVILKKNGEQIGETSAEIRGWEVEFPRNDKHTYRIDSDRTATYSLELWDDQLTNELILSITELKLDSFEEPIHERLGIYDPPELATVIKFVRRE